MDVPHNNHHAPNQADDEESVGSLGGRTRVFLLNGVDMCTHPVDM